MSYLNKKSVRDVDLTDKRVLMRVDFNVPIKNRVIRDDTRIRASLPTINYLLEQNAAVLLMSHLGRPKGLPNKEYTLRPVAQRLSELLGRKVDFVPDCVGPLALQASLKLRRGQVVLLENVRFHKEEEKNAPVFAAALSSLADLYVNDAFGTAHRAHASTAGICRYIPSVAGLLMEEELATLGKLISDPERPFVAVVGGAKISDKIQVFENMLNIVDKLLVGGGMANTFLAASGHHLGASLVEVEQFEWAASFLQTEAAKNKLVLPVDMVAAASFSAEAERVTCPVDEIPQSWTALDIGPRTCEIFNEHLRAARTIFWNGPVGVFEMEPFSVGTFDIAETVAASDAFSVVGGGDSIAAINQAGVTDRISHVSTGGGASLEFLEGKILPGVNALEDK